MTEKLFHQKVISREEMLRRKMENIQKVAELQEAELALAQSQKGRDQSMRIAAAAI